MAGDVIKQALTDFSHACAGAGELADDGPAVTGGVAVVAAVAPCRPRGRREHHHQAQHRRRLRARGRHHRSTTRTCLLQQGEDKAADRRSRRRRRRRAGMIRWIAISPTLLIYIGMYASCSHKLKHADRNGGAAPSVLLFNFASSQTLASLYSPSVLKCRLFYLF